MGYTLSEFRLEELSTATFKFATVQLPSEPLFGVLVVKFVGVADNDRAHFGTFRFMRAVTMAGLEACSPRPFGLVLDLSLLDYVWGDTMAQVLTTGKRWAHWDFPTTVVVSHRNERGLTSLVAQEMSADPKRWLFPTLASAVEAVDQLIQGQRKRST
jgi:hypothetical protein